MKDLAKASARQARMSKAVLELFKLSVDMKSMRTLPTTVSSLETKVLDLGDLVKECGEIMLKIFTGKISIARYPSGQAWETAGWVTQAAVFDRYKAMQKREMAILEQEIGGGGFTIGSLVFTTLQDSISYCGRHFPSGSHS